ncbi:MAG: FAD-dependent oxidoreductase [Candidatus Obscuribacterales bacterium]|nr:FAD-dependent oxidoreductase [Candidatus Obscuribacterales bacterium]
MRQFLKKLVFLLHAALALNSIVAPETRASHLHGIPAKPMTSKKLDPKYPEQFTVIDIQALDEKDPEAAIKTITCPVPDRTIKCDVLVAGGGMGGVAAAHALTRTLNGETGRRRRPRVCLLEETNWLGGQMTSQAVSAFDENALVETSGASRHYLKLRELIRDYYLDRYSVKEECKGPRFNPGNCWVSRLSFEPKIGLHAIDSMLEQAIRDDKLEIFHRTKVVKVDSQLLKNGKHKIKSLLAANLESGETIEFRPRIVIDATELGDLLPLAQVSYRLGEEGKDATGEPHAAPEPQSEWVQDFIFPFVVEFCPDQNHTIEKPTDYEKLRDQGQFTLLGYKMFETTMKGDRELLPFWTYRRLIDSATFQDLAYQNDIAMINWEANDVSDRNFIDKDPQTMVRYLAEAKQISLGFLYWLQTEAPRDDGGKGYPELKLREDILQSADGLSKYPYIRESRRIIPERLVVENDIGVSFNSGARARFCKDSVGIGHYPIDIHGPQEKGAAQETRPFQIPMGALLPKDAENLLPACKNLGVSHLANGAYRLHPVEWAIGTASGIIAREAVMEGSQPHKYFQDKDRLLSLQKLLVHEGEPIYWFDDVPVDHFAFAQIQLLAATGTMTGDTDSLHFNPDKPISRQMAAKIAARVIDRSRSAGILIKDVDENHPFSAYINSMVGFNIMDLDRDFSFRPAAALTIEELSTMAESRQLRLPSRSLVHIEALSKSELDSNPQALVTRAQFAEWIAAVITYKKKWEKLAKELREGPLAAN